MERLNQMFRKIIIISMVSILALLTTNVIVKGAGRQYPKAKLVVEVVDEEGRPVEGATAFVGFETYDGKSLGVDSYAVTGITSQDGKCSLEGFGTSYVTYGAIKEGYYKTYGEPIIFKTKSNEQWEPWGKQVKVELRKRISPVPMYTKLVDVEIPALNKPIGFDLEKGDWVLPYGNGVVKDFIFYTTNEFKHRRDYKTDLKIFFSNDGDGILETKIDEKYGSDFKMDRFAPEQGYKTVFLESISRSPNKIEQHSDPQRAFYFRVRTKKEGDRIVEANYGKITLGIDFGPISSEIIAVRFKYYFNPDKTRNLEFDPQKNLLQNLKSFEGVGVS